MFFGIARTLSPELLQKSTTITLLDRSLEMFFAERIYGSGLKSFVIGIVCVHPKFDILYNKLNKKYIKSKKLLEYQIAIGYNDLYYAKTETKIVDVILKEILASLRIVEELKIEDFDLYSFKNDLIYFSEKELWLQQKDISLLTKRDQDVDSRLDSMAPEINMMPAESFWDLIEVTKTQSNGLFGFQLKLLAKELSKRSVEEIIGFELTFRKELGKSFHYNVMAVAKIIDDFVTDDSFLYFRCRLMALGKSIYLTTIEDPEASVDGFLYDIDGEGMLFIADNAFKEKCGNVSEYGLPSQIALEFLDYDMNKDEVMGEDWKEEDLPSIYPLFWAKYRNNSNKI